MNADILDILKRFALPTTIGIIVAICLAAGGWFFYLHQQQSVIDAARVGRGLGDTASFGFPVGSAYTNVVNAIAGVFGGNQATSTPQETGAAPRLWEVAAAPVAGIGWTDATSSTVRFMDQASGNVFDGDPRTSAITRRTNTLVPRITEAALAGNEGIIARYLDEQGIETMYSTITASIATTSLAASAAEALAAAGPGTLKGIMLPRGILSLVPDPVPSSDQVFYLAAYNGGVGGFLAHDDGSKPSRIWGSPLSGWSAAWAGSHLVLAQKPANGVPGTAYDLSVKGAVTPLVNSQPGLSVLENPKTGAVLYSTASGSTLKLSLETSGTIEDLPFSTLADKCVWSSIRSTLVFCAVPHALPSGLYPDAWYRGEAHTADAWWRFDTASGAVAEVYDPADANRSLDILNPVMSADGNYIAFMDAASGTGWVLRVND